VLKNETEITLSDLQAEVGLRLHQGYRFVTMTCCDTGDGHDIFYHFDKDYDLQNLRLKLPKGHTLPSVSGIFFAAALAENEIRDLFGVTVTGLVIDYAGKFMLSEGAPEAPLSKGAGAAPADSDPAKGGSK
jgi:ech hydrogenase subunit D